MEKEFEVREELQEKRKQIKTFDDLVEFLKDVKDNYNTGYGEAPRAMAQACLAVGYYLSKEFEITEFQANCVMWDFVYDWQYPYNKCGLRIINFDEMLYPQYESYFEKTISAVIFEKIKEQAKEKLKIGDNCVHPDVVNHWKSIAEGNVPFGYKIDKNK